MKGKSVILVLIITILAFYAAGIVYKFDYLKFWPRVFLGIAGLFFMTIMHIYSLRKRNQKFILFKIFPFKLPVFLNIHIFLATFGVSLIIVHAFGSYDSMIAWISFFSMFMVWQSGFVGRYIFVKIPKNSTGLTLEKNSVVEELESANVEFIRLMKDNHDDKAFQEFLIQYLSGYGKSLHLLHTRDESSIMRIYFNLKKIIKAWTLYKSNLAVFKKNAMEWIEKNASMEKKLYEEHVNQYKDKMNAILLLHFQIEFFDVLKSLFKNWHDIHVPLTYLFYTTAILHVIVIVLFSSYAK
ncbi:MAG: hypothetical protein OEV66_04505 [Spirochaetia bacterium]|nr:hypothetical protein [Spirochaetia bacterium]